MKQYNGVPLFPSQQFGHPAEGFGLAVSKSEGAAIDYDSCPGLADPRHRFGKGEKRPVGNDWMELPIPKNMGRARVHKMVDEWLDGRAKGPRGMGA